MKIEVNLDNDVAARLKIAAKAFKINEGDLINEYLKGYTRKGSKGIPGKLTAENIDDIFNGLQDALTYFTALIKAIKIENSTADKKEVAA